MHILASLLIFVVLASGAAAQQRLGPPEKRPKLAAGADTNDAAAYFSFASRALATEPGDAAAAFYWAARLDPSSAEALDGRRAAMLMRRTTTLRSYMEGNRRARESKEFKALDSLFMRALRLDPLYYRKYDQAMLLRFYRGILRDAYPTAAPTEIDMEIEAYIVRTSPYTRGWWAYGKGDLEAALESFEGALKGSRNPGPLRLERARIYALQGKFPAALSEFRTANELLSKRERDKDEDVIFYNSKAMVEHSIALVQANLNQPDSARAALGRAITEDLSYFMAHVELGKLALAARDTATAISELALAAELAADEPYVHFMHGNTLLTAGQAGEAVGPLKKALELEPVYSAAQFSLASALDRTGDKAAARDAYTRFLAISARRDAQRRTIATDRIEALK